ncbi:UDP-glucuronosyltransferase 2A2-like [Clarias gariepinus]|uniref:UDP-glucuronosyltransferase 2A2-like n=1 Tax=Clarias gariepinus TaxID=13013 RepID=UPI00234E12A7|nr:UDP-glucuronosyltransferase 2A2-like [Clarias gariepinus]XP_053344256.1 UDP-glucuronosyltransferase 2A2-like [Clarias gariepinus]
MYHSALLRILMLLFLPCMVYSGHILVYPVDGSHWINMKVLIMELHSKGHDITVLQDSRSKHIKEESPYYTSISLDVGVYDDDFFSTFMSHLLQAGRKKRSIWSQIMFEQEVMKKLSETHEKICNMTAMIFENETLMTSLQQAKFDLVLADPAMGGGALLAHKLGLPLVFNVRWTVQGEGHFAIAPSPLSYVPVPGAELTDKMTFFERVTNVLIYFISYYQHSIYFDQHYRAFCQKYFGPGVDYLSILQNADIWLMRNDFTFEFPRPTMPNVVYMGGFQCKPSNPLPDDLEKFVQSSGKHGVIIMSLGVFFGELLGNITDEIAAAFAQLPQKVIWRHTGARPSTLGNNTLLVNWMPQNDLLGHSKTRVFVAHGGTNGIQEAIYHGVPILGLPIAFDQPDNLSRMRKKGTAKVLDISELDRSIFLEALKEVLYNPSYRENMQKLSRLHHDQPIKPLNHAIFWIEYVIRNGGAPHLRSHSFRMSWITYNSVDVMLTLLGAVLLFCWLTFLLLRCLCFTVIFKKKLKPE